MSATHYLANRRLHTSAQKTILVIAWQLPQPDRSTAFRSTWHYLTLLRRMDWRVVLLAHDGVRREPYATQLEALGVVVLVGPFFLMDRLAWIQRNARYLDCIMADWPLMADTYFDFCRARTSARLIYASLDLQAERRRREHALTGDPQALARAQRVESLEARAFAVADAIITFSCDELAVLARLYGNKVFHAPLFAYDTFLSPPAQPPSGSALLFVGNFWHAPNSDGAQWFARKVLPLICADRADVKWWIVGANAPTGVQALQSDYVELRGAVSEEELASLYQQARVVVAPLRFGAGVKGKVIEAMWRGVPVVTTRVGVEGVPGLDQIISPTDAAGEMADAVLTLLRDDARWLHISRAGQQFVAQHFSAQVAQEYLRQVLDWLAERAVPHA